MSTESSTDPRVGAATTAAAAAPASAPRRSRNGYGGMWLDVPREFLFLVFTMPVALIATIVVTVMFFLGAGLVFLVIGIFLVIGAMFAARGFGSLELVRLEWAGRPPVRRPQWEPAGRQLGFWRQVFAPFVDGHYWLYLLHTVVINPVVSAISWGVTIAWTSLALGGTTGWIWQRYIDDGDRGLWLHRVVLDFLFPGNDLAIDPRIGETVFEIVVGLVFLATLPLVYRLLTLMHQGVARGLLGSWRSEALEREVEQLQASRGAAVEAEDQSLRRLERDIHDGPQQRLVRLQMDLAAIERRLGDDPDAARELLAEARGQTRDALEELRALSRGFAPPILQDRGLAAALDSLVARSPVPVAFENKLAADAGLPPSLERNAYFIVAELLTNAAKHANASGVRLVVSTRAANGARWLDLWVTDNGTGGASVRPGHGLAGLDERVRGLRGILVVESPAGGPTIAGAHLPY